MTQTQGAAAPYASGLFLYDKRRNRFSACASDLRWQPGQRPHQVRMRSDRTGAVKAFRLRDTIVNADDEVIGWTYSCPDCGGMTLRVYND